MIQKTASLFILVLVWISVSAQISPQLYGDEWIVEGQPYFKFSISEEGIYRLPLHLLEEHGVSLGDLTDKDVHIYSFGSSIPIRVSTSGTLTSESYIEFFATGMDGTVDALLYEDADRMQLNPYVSLYQSQRPYFLTISDDTSSKRYTEINNGLNAIGLPPKETYYIHKEIHTYSDFLHKPTHDGRNFIRYSSMDVAEGYGSRLERDRTITFDVDELSSFGVGPKLSMRFGTNVLSQVWQLSTEKRDLRILPKPGYQVVEVEEKFPLQDLSNGTFDVHLSPLSDEQEKTTLARVELQYPRNYIFDQLSYISFHQQPAIISRLIEAEGFVGRSPILYNLSRQLFVYPERSDDQLVRLVTPASQTLDHWILVDEESGIKSVSSISAIDFGKPINGSEYLIISNQKLNAAGDVQAYAEYRNSEQGGSYDTHVAYMADLYERYSYGVEGHPIAIKNALRQLRSKDSLPDYTLIIGKGLQYSELAKGESLVPTFGLPGSDNMYLALGHQRHPLTPIGRIAATSPDQVKNYLEKIKAHEVRYDEEQTSADQSWKKDIIHLSGGSAYNQATLYNFLDDMASVISNNTFGADVTTFRKVTADPLQRTTTAEIMAEIDGGTSFLTFFGHSAVGTFDFSLEDPSKYQNVGRNPIILSLGCHSGNIHTPSSGISEEFVLEPEDGAIAFIASSGTAYPEPQYETGIIMYELLGGEMYGATIGDILQRSLELRSEKDLLSVQTLIEQLTLHGDPAFRPYTFEGPDYIVDTTSVRLSPNVIHATTERITMDFSIMNIGKSQPDALDIRISHILPNGDTADIQDLIIPSPASSTPISVDILNPNINWTGDNKILIQIDPDNLVVEMPDPKAKSNNNLLDASGNKGLSFYVLGNSAKPIYPSNYGILSTQDIIVRAAVNNGLYPGGTFQLEIDTTELFNSPLLKVEVIENENSIIEWRPNIERLKNTVYYWRIAPIETNVNLKSSSWQGASFIYEPGGHNGWHQSHYYQWLDNAPYKMSLLPETRTWKYDDRQWDVRIKNEVREEGDFWVYVNNVPWSSLNPRGGNSYLHIFAWDRQDVIFKNNGSDYGSIPFTKDGFLYDMQHPNDAANVIRLLEAIPHGSRVFFHTMLASEDADLHIENWNSSGLLNYLESQGATRTDELLERGTVPYTFIFDKNSTSVIEDIAHHKLETIDLTSTARALWQEGSITSTRIPTQQALQTLYWSEEKEASDQTSLVILGINAFGIKDTLLVVQDEYEVDVSHISTSVFPELELVYVTEDPGMKTAPHLSYWRVTTTDLPDASFHTMSNEFYLADTMHAGEELVIDFDIQNLNNTDMSEFGIKYTLIDKNYKENTIIVTQDELKGQDTASIDYTIGTQGLEGAYQLIIELNPNEIVKESSYCNNLGFASFYVIPDKANPFIDVTFDDRHIRDGDLLTTMPKIEISLSDPGSFLLLEDPEDWEVTLFYPQILRWQVDTSSKDVEWIPAMSLDDNTAKMQFTPHLNLEGIYTLEIQARDPAGNYAATEPYRITFEVSLTEGHPVLEVGPNPVIEYVDFRYLLETDDLPPVFNLFIYSADGQRVHAVDMDGFGGLTRGVNTYRWYPLTDDGRPLPTGVYYYEIINSFDRKEDKPRGGLLVLNQ